MRRAEGAMRIVWILARLVALGLTGPGLLDLDHDHDHERTSCDILLATGSSGSKDLADTLSGRNIDVYVQLDSLSSSMHKQ